jgi:twinkle protein
MNLATKIQSLQQTVNVSYTRPDQARYQEMVGALRDSPGYKYLTEERGFTDETIQHFGLGYDKKKNAIAIPHFKDSELINIKYRFLKPKDIRYTSEPNAEQWLFHDEGLAVALEKGAVAIAEGEFDCISLWQAGFKNVISPGSGANSYGLWLETIDKIKSVWIAYDSDEPGQLAAKELATRIGIDKCRNVEYPKETKDANDYLKSHTPEQLRELFAKAKPLYKTEFDNLPDIIRDMVESPRDYMMTKLFPEVRLYKDNLTVLTGVTNSGKSSLSLNIAIEMARNGVPVLILPLERGTYTVGRRLIQIAINKTEEEIEFTPKEEIYRMTEEVAQLPIYFSMPDKNKLLETITRAKRLFGIRYVIIDQIDQAVRNTSGNKEIAISDAMRDLKKLSESLPVAILVVAHIRKLSPGEKISMDALKGSNSLSTDPETVVLLDAGEDYIEVIVAKNKGKMRRKRFVMEPSTGVVEDTYDDF